MLTCELRLDGLNCCLAYLSEDGEELRTAEGAEDGHLVPQRQQGPPADGP
jgi:hypothetical protein